MNSSVLLKSYTKGISIHLDPEADIDLIKKDLAERFHESAAFFKDASMAISFEDRILDSQTERELVNIITANSQVKVMCVAGKDKLTQTMITNAINQLEYKSEIQKDVSVQILSESVKDGRVVEVPGSILILGDVYPGASVIAGGDIYIYGGLFGQAYAGNDGDINRIILSLDMNAEKLRIAGIKYKPSDKPKWSIKNKQTPIPKCAHLVGSEVIVDAIDNKFWTMFSPRSLNLE